MNEGNTSTSHPDFEAAPAVAQRLLDALGAGEFEALGDLLAADVWLRALLVREVHESNSAGDAIAAFRSWVAGANGRRLLRAERSTMAGRELLRYRFLVRPRWAPEEWHVIEQTGYCKVHDGLITRIDLVCTGYFPADGWMG